MAREGLMDDSGYHGFDFECEGVCGHCGNKDCIWYDDFMDGEEEEEE